MEPKFPDVYVPLLGQSGNAALIIGRTREALRRGGASRDEQEAYQSEAMSGDYDHVLQTTMGWVSIGEPPPEVPDYDPARCPDCGSDDYYPGTVGCRSCGSERMPAPGEDDGS